MDGTAPTYGAPRAAQLAGISYRQLDYWTRAGAVAAEVHAAGSGSRRRFSEHQVCILRALGDLAALRADTALLRGVSRSLSACPLSEWDGMAYVDSDGWLGREPRRGTWVLDLADCRRAVADRIREPVAA